MDIDDANDWYYDVIKFFDGDAQWGDGGLSPEDMPAVLDDEDPA
jgi:hypothetical protein